jgi:hypothetical protein
VLKRQTFISCLKTMTTCDEVEEKMRRYWTLALNEGQWSGSRFGRFTLGSMTFSFARCLILPDWAMKLSRRIRYVVAQLVEDSGGRDSPDNHSNKNNCGNWSNQYTLGIPHTVSFDYKKTCRYLCNCPLLLPDFDHNFNVPTNATRTPQCDISRKKNRSAVACR